MVYGNEKMNLPCAFLECARSLHFTLLAVTGDFNHPSKEHINYISIDLSTEIMSIQNDESKLGSSFKYCSNTNTIFSCYYSMKGRPHYKLKIFSHMIISCIYLVQSFQMYLQLKQTYQMEHLERLPQKFLSVRNLSVMKNFQYFLVKQLAWN